MTNVAEKKSERAHSALLEASWMVAVIGALKDEEVLAKQRRKGGGKGKDKEGEGKGKEGK